MDIYEVTRAIITILQTDEEVVTGGSIYSLKDLCGNRVIDSYDIFQDKVQFPKITIDVEEKGYSHNGIAITLQYSIRSWVKEGRAYKVHDKIYSPRDIARMMDIRVRELLDKKENILTENYVIYKMSVVSGSIYEAIKEKMAISQLTIFEAIVSERHKK